MPTTFGPCLICLLSRSRPLGTGTVDVERHLRTLKASGYDGTITLEVFSPDRHYLAYSRDLLRRIWDENRPRH